MASFRLLSEGHAYEVRQEWLGHSMKLEPIYPMIGTLIRVRRRNLNLSQNKLAAKLRISRATLANIETGRQRILVHQLFAFANALEVSANNLLPTVGENKPADMSKLTIQGDVSSVQREQIAAVLGSELSITNQKDSDDKTVQSQSQTRRTR